MTNQMDETNLQICSRCIYDAKTPGIKFDENGICNYCHLIEQLESEYKTGTPEGERLFLNIIEQIKREGKGKKYDCVVGVSGGTDSSYMLYKAVEEWKLRPLAAHYDNTWNSAIATENIRKITKALRVDLFTYVIDNKESDDIFRAFFKASVPELDGCTDIALAEVLYRAAGKNKIRYILEGHSFRTEGISPLGIMYVDGKYIDVIHKKFGNSPMKTFPNMRLFTFLKWIALKRIKKIRPLWYINYSKEEARGVLQQKFGWKYYGGHHLENRMTAMHHSYYFPNKVGIDQRNNSLSAAVRSGVLSREKALELYQQPPFLETELIEYFKKRLELTDEEFNEIMKKPLRTFHDFKTYKKTFERMRPFFWLMYKMNLVPKSFYIKYTSKKEI
jgi:N-acetyl sugar amidotransferase